MIRLGLLGASGRMGQWVTRLAESEFHDRAIVAEKASEGHSIGPLLKTDVVIDFSSPRAMSQLAKAAIDAHSPLPAFVVGSTGWNEEETATLEALSKLTPVLMTSNFSTGVLALLEILRSTSPMLKKLGYTPVIVETHHRHKKDAPSGTALALQRAIAPEASGTVQTCSVRAGEIIGDHEITFYGPGDHLTIGHFAQDRSIFARGAIEAALWLSAQRKGHQPGRGILSMQSFFQEQFR